MSIVSLSKSEKKRFTTIQASLIEWYNKNRRTFSWRKNIRDPYEVLVCEVMGQQTQASRIEQYLPRFLTRFPTVKSLASAKQSDVIKEWQGLGYNRRALHLYRAAKELSEVSFPKSEKELLALPGIGKYTARAVLIFAYNKPLAAVDINIQRLLSRLYKKMPDSGSMLPTNVIYELGESILPIKRSRLWHEALMDFGATICTKKNPSCSRCPLFHECRSGKTLMHSSSFKKTTESSEPKYFGFPKRIWRGRVLKIISIYEAVSEQMICQTLRGQSPRFGFVPFIRDVLDDLVREGFCTRKNRIYHLND